MGKSYNDIKTGMSTFASATLILETVGKEGIKQLNNQNGMGLFAQTMIPAIVLKAFTCELALKALISKANKDFGKDHKLDALYQILDECDKKEISKGVITRIKNEKSDYNEKQFMIDLSENAKLFVDWRYFYENPVKANLLFLNALFDELKEYIK